MAFRFRKSIKIAPGVRMNFGMKGGSLSVGGRGHSVNFGSRGVSSNIGIPGTGLNYHSRTGGQSTNKYNKSQDSESPDANKVNLNLSLQDNGEIAFKDENGDVLPDYAYAVIQTKKQNKEFIVKWLEENCDEINQKIESLINIHLTTPPPDTIITFVPANFNELSPVQPSETFPDAKPTPPTLKEYGFFAKRIEFLQKSVDKKNSELQLTYQNKVKEWEENKALFEADYIVKYNEYQERLKEFNNAMGIFNEKQDARKKFIEEERLANSKAMQEFLSETLQDIIWARETNVSFDVVNDGKCVLLDVDLPEIEDMPEQQGTVSKKDLKIVYKDISETQNRKNYYTHIHAIGFRLIGEVFVSLPTVSVVVLSGYSQRPDKKTGNIVNEYLYSVRATRDKWENINFNNLNVLDVSAFFETLDLRRKATKTGVITPIEPFES